LGIQVKASAGYPADEAPRAFVLGNRRITIAEELERWLSPEHCYFKVLDDDGDTYILCHDVPSDGRELILCDTGGGHGPRRSPT